jgi:hypothetical protein
MQINSAVGWSASAFVFLYLIDVVFCNPLQVWLIWPFLVWGGAVAVSYGMGYSLLGMVNEPMCLFNIVNYMSAGFKYTLFLSQVRAWSSTSVHKLQPAYVPGDCDACCSVKRWSSCPGSTPGYDQHCTPYISIM